MFPDYVQTQICSEHRCGFPPKRSGVFCILHMTCSTVRRLELARGMPAKKGHKNPRVQDFDRFGVTVV